jgi:predicted enzyme related to lactoylglutathione lyase
MNHPRHSFCFAELETYEFDLCTQQYRDLFGWDAVDLAPGYSLFQSGGNVVAALRVTGVEHRWVPYVSVERVDEVATRAQQLGATVQTPAFDTPDVARTCVLRDPEGAWFGLWESRGRAGADVQNEPGTMWWVELMARDVKKARGFYVDLFEWTFDETLKFSDDPNDAYTVFRIGEESVAGAAQYRPEWGYTSHWRILFAVDDWEAALSRIAKIGGEVVFWRDVPHAGRFGIVIDPGEAELAVMKPLAR